MNYDDKYPGTGPGTQKEGYMLKGQETKPCWRCNKETNWLDIDFQAYLCSEECSLDAWEAFKKTYDTTR